MSREKDLFKNTLILSIGRFVPQLMSIITLPILTARLTKAEYGTYDLITTLIMLVIPIATLQIQSAAFRFLIDCRGDQLRSSEIISNIFIVTIPVSLVVCIGIQCAFPGLPGPVRLLVGSYFFLDTIYLTMGQIARGLGKNRDYSIGAIMLSVINMLGVVLLVNFSGKGLWGVYASLTAANAIALIFIISKTKLPAYLRMSVGSLGMIKELLAYSWPMVPNNLSTWVLKLSDRLVITAFLGIEANAVYGVANKVPNILSMAQSIMVMAWQENASIAAKDTDARKYYSKMLDFCFSFMAGASALLIGATPILFRLLIRGDYAEAYFQMPVLILAMFFFAMSSYFGGIYIAFKKTVSVGITTMAAAAVNLIIDLCLVRVIGITAGSLSTLVAYIILYVYRMIDVQKFQKVNVNIQRQALQVLVILVMLILCFLQRPLLNLINILAGIIVFIAFNRQPIGHMLKVIRAKIEKK